MTYVSGEVVANVSDRYPVARLHHHYCGADIIIGGPDEVRALISDLQSLAAKVSPLCQWPKCPNDAMCGSGNFGNLLVCSDHFTVTNGTSNNAVKFRAAVREVLRQFDAGECTLARVADVIREVPGA